MSFSDPEDTLDGFNSDDAPYGSVLDLPFEAGDPDPGPITYGDVGAPYDPQQDWRDKQKQHRQDAYGEFGPDDLEQVADKDGKPMPKADQEATDG